MRKCLGYNGFPSFSPIRQTRRTSSKIQFEIKIQTDQHGRVPRCTAGYFFDINTLRRKQNVHVTTLLTRKNQVAKK